jgi:hypothetical protein
MSAIDAYTGTEYEEGSKGFDDFTIAEKVAQTSPTREIYWDGNELMALVPDKVEPIDTPIVFVDPKEKPDLVQPFDPSKEEKTPKGIYYVIQVSAVRDYKAYKYKELEKGQLSKYQISFEEIEMGIKRVLIVPKSQNEDGTEGFKTKADALNVLYHILNNSQFTRAFVIEYTDGKRSGEGFRGMNDES